MPDYSEEIKTIGQRLVVIADALKPAPDPGPDPEPEPEPQPGPEVSRVVNADKLSLHEPKTLFLDGDHIGLWGQPSEGVAIKVKTPKAQKIEVALLYTLARESQTTPSTRRVSVGDNHQQLTMNPTQETWGEKFKTWSSRVKFDVPQGESTIRITNDTANAWSNWLDLFSVGLTSTDGEFEVLEVGGSEPVPDPEPQPEPEPVPVPVPTGTLDQLLDTWFPAKGQGQYIEWGQDLRNVPAGAQLILRNGEKRESWEWILHGLKGKPDNWIRIKAESPLGFRARDVGMWRGLGIWNSEYVHVDGIDLYGRGDDLASALECVGGHHIAVTRCRATDTGGHAVSGSWDGQEGNPINAPRCMFVGWCIGIETSRRNPFAGSAFNLFHGTSQAGDAWGPLKHLGYTDYFISNVAFGCISEVWHEPWGVTDGNAFIADLGVQSGYNGKCLVAFQVGANNGGRFIHALRTNNVHGVFSTGVGNLQNVTGGNGELTSAFSDTYGAIFRGNIIAATAGSQQWFEDWAGGNGDAITEQNVILAGSAPRATQLHPDGLQYLVGATHTSRNLDDYRPRKGKGIQLLGKARELFDEVARVFPDAKGEWREQPIAGALDAAE